MPPACFTALPCFTDLERLFDRPLKELTILLREIEIICDRQRNVPPHRGVLPVTISCYLNKVDDHNRMRCEQTIRKDCVTLWQAGLLERMGGAGSRRGYRLAA